MRDLIVYHAGTGTILPLSDKLYVFDATRLSWEDIAALETGMTNRQAYAMGGVELDNYNIGNLFGFPE